MTPNTLSKYTNPFWKQTSSGAKIPTISNAVKKTTPAPNAVTNPVAVSAPATFTNPTVNTSGLNSLVQAIANQVRVPTKQYSLNDVFSRNEQNLARRNIASRVARVLDPEQREGQTNISENFAGRGLFRSGLRTRDIQDFNADIAEKRQTQQEELYNIRLQEALEELQRRQQEAERQAALSIPDINFRQYI